MSLDVSGWLQHPTHVSAEPDMPAVGPRVAVDCAWLRNFIPHHLAGCDMLRLWLETRGCIRQMVGRFQHQTDAPIPRIRTQKAECDMDW
jgi:uncharacterized protein (DUF305 family)